MKKVFLVLFSFAFIFSFDLTALADEGHSHDIEQGTSNAGNKSTANQKEDHAKKNQDNGSVHEDMEMQGESEHEDVDTNGESEHEGGHHRPVVETPPNYNVLGTYGGVNLAFILVGVWNKWFRRKGDEDNGNA